MKLKNNLSEERLEESLIAQGYDSYQIYEIMKGIQLGLDVSEYLDPGHALGRYGKN